MEPLHIRQDPRFFLQPLVLQFQIEVAFAEDVQHFQSFLFRAFVITVEEPVRDLPRQTGRQGNQPFVILAQDVFIDPRFIVEAVTIPFGYDLHQVLVALVVLSQQHQVAHPLVPLSILVEQSPGSRIHLAADDRANALFFAFSIKIDDPEHHAMIRNGQRRHAQVLCTRHQISDPGSPVQQTVFRMYM